MGTFKSVWMLAALIGGATPLVASAQSLGAPRSPWSLSVSGLTSHFKDPECKNCSYRTTVPGLGLQRDFRSTPQSRLRFSLSGGLQSDSFGGSGGYAAAIASVLSEHGRYTLSAGLGAFGIYRYMEHGSGAEDAKRVFVPAILPVFSVENTKAGMGANVVVAPNFSYRGRDRSGFVLLQFSYRFGGSTAPSGWAMQADPGLRNKAGRG